MPTTTLTWLYLGPGLVLGPSPSRSLPPRVTCLRESGLHFSMSLGYPPRWQLQLDSMARVTCPGPAATPRLGPSLATGQRPSDHAGPEALARPSQWAGGTLMTHAGRAWGGRPGSARRRAESPPPPQPGREVSRRGLQCKPAGERVPKLPAPRPKHGGRQGKRGGQGRSGAQRGAVGGLHAGLHLAAEGGHRGPHLPPRAYRGPTVLQKLCQPDTPTWPGLEQCPAGPSPGQQGGVRGWGQVAWDRSEPRVTQTPLPPRGSPDSVVGLGFS